MQAFMLGCVHACRDAYVCACPCLLCVRVCKQACCAYMQAAVCTSMFVCMCKRACEYDGTMAVCEGGRVSSPVASPSQMRKPKVRDTLQE